MENNQDLGQRQTERSYALNTIAKNRHKRCKKTYNNMLMGMKIYSTRPELSDKVTRALQAIQLPEKCYLTILVSDAQPESLPQTSVVHSRNFGVRRLADNTLVCSRSGHTIPPTPKGGLNLDLLADEIASHPRLYPL